MRTIKTARRWYEKMNPSDDLIMSPVPGSPSGVAGLVRFIILSPVPGSIFDVDLFL